MVQSPLQSPTMAGVFISVRQILLEEQLINMMDLSRKYEFITVHFPPGKSKPFITGHLDHLGIGRWMKGVELVQMTPLGQTVELLLILQLGLLGNTVKEYILTVQITKILHWQLMVWLGTK